MEEKPMVRLLVVETDVEANFFKGSLEDNGIAALVKGLDGSAFGAALDGPDEIEMYVYSDDLEEAKALADGHPFLSAGTGEFSVDIFELFPAPF